MPDNSIGRFKAIRSLGKGRQGEVLLAEDTQLGRQVAIKTLHSQSREKVESLLHEARIVSQLQHPNIVPLYDAGEQQGAAYLVCAYIEGGTLADMLKEGALPLVKSAEIACSLLEALEYAHARGVMHLDIKPAHIMMGQRGQPMLMDFGIARLMTEPGEQDESLSGSPQYMAPERISGEGVDARADLFSLGAVLYEMVTGRPAYSGDDRLQVMNRIVHEKVVTPSSLNLAVDGRLEEIILKSMARKREDRYQDAAAMRDGLKAYLEAAAVAGSADARHSTLQFLLRRMRGKSDFPALSHIITDINNIVASETEGTSKLARAILRDFALTNKLLRLVNTVSFSQFGGKINTISKAVVILGFNTVRNIATSLILLEFMQNRSQAQQLKDEVISCFFAGVVAAQLSVGRDLRDAEEVMICSMFHNLGRILVTFYFFEESQEIARLIEQEHSEEHAAIKVLGLTYSELGIGVAKSWNLPLRLLAGMEKFPGGEKIKKPSHEMASLTVTVNLANELCAIAATTPSTEKDSALLKLQLRYAGATNISKHKLSEALEAGLGELSRRAVMLEINTLKGPLVQNVRKWIGLVIPDQKEEPSQEQITLSQAKTLDGLEGIQRIEAVLSSDGQEGVVRETPETVLSAGIQDVINTLVEEFNLNDLLLMVLETMYRGLGFTHAMIFIRDNKRNVMAARIGLGAGVDAVLPQFQFSLEFQPDVFHLAIEKGADIVIEDVSAANIADKIPAWHRGLGNARSFILLPVVVNKKVVGLFYADMATANSLQISERQLSLLRTLRNQAVLAIKQKML